MSSNAIPYLVKGEILFSKELGSFSGARVHIYLEDVSLQDASAKIMAQQTITEFSHESGTEDRVAFSLQSGTINSRASYSIRAHITFHDDGYIHRGDYISTESYPALTDGCPNQMLVNVTEVK